MPTLHPPWPADVVQAVCDVLGATDYPGLTGSEISDVLRMAHAPDIDPSAAKRRRLYAALLTRQQRDRASNSIMVAITSALALGRHVQDHDRFYALRAGLDPALSLVGLRVNDAGKLKRAARASTLDEVARLAGRLSSELTRRHAHPEALLYCQQELLRESTFHAVSEATKGLAQRLRNVSGSALDGAELVDACFSTKNGRPVVRINGFITQSEISEHKGFANFLKGIFGTFRNPTAHAPREYWPISEADALDLFSTLSYLHRRLDQRR
jgi:uncharacterized protein (TIGR02391 family)